TPMAFRPRPAHAPVPEPTGRNPASRRPHRPRLQRTVVAIRCVAGRLAPPVQTWSSLRVSSHPPSPRKAVRCRASRDHRKASPTPLPADATVDGPDPKVAEAGTLGRFRKVAEGWHVEAVRWNGCFGPGA